MGKWYPISNFSGTIFKISYFCFYRGEEGQRLIQAEILRDRRGTRGPGYQGTRGQGNQGTSGLGARGTLHFNDCRLNMTGTRLDGNKLYLNPLDPSIFDHF